MAGFREKGYDAGLQVANDCRKEIRACKDKDALARLCGSKIETLKKHSAYWIAQYPSFCEGFFNAFMSRGEDLLGR